MKNEHGNEQTSFFGTFSSFSEYNRIMKKVLFMDFFGVFAEETVAVYYRNHHFTREQQEEANRLFREGDLGNILYPEIRERLGKRDGTSKEEADKEFFEIARPKKDTIETEWKLKKEGYKIYLLSNASSGHLRPLLEDFKLIPLFDKRYISAEIHHAKPDIDYWLYVLKDLNLKAEDTVRIDDRVRNIQAAEKAGCHGIVFVNAAQRERDIRSLD